MIALPQIRLRTVFFVFLCAAVGLAIGTSPDEEADPAFTLFGWENAQLSWHFALLSAATVAIIAGLLKEIAFLRRSHALDGTRNRAQAFAVHFATYWRAAVCGLLIACLISALLLSGRLIELPETDTFFSYALFPYAVWVLCLIVVLSASAVRLRQPVAARKNSWRVAPVWIAGVLLAALVLPDVTLVHGLVHIATASIEGAQPAAHQRQSAFPDHRAERFQTFWLSTAATAAALTGAASLLSRNRHRNRPWTQMLPRAVAFTLSLLIMAAFILWYYGREFQRISPDLASVSVASNPLEWAAGIVLASILVTAGAHRLSAANCSVDSIQLDLGNDDRSPFVYESLAVLFCSVSAVVIYVTATAYTFFNAPWGLIWSPMRVAEILVGMMKEPGVILMMVVLLLSVQVGVARWRKQLERTSWRIDELEPRRFVWNWIALAVLTCLAIPTIAAFLFLFWLGPWYLYGP